MYCHETDDRGAMSVSQWGKHVKGLKTCHETDVGHSTSVSQREKLAEERFHGHETDVRSAMSVSRQGKTRQDRQDRPLSEGEAEAGAGGDHERLAGPEGLQ